MGVGHTDKQSISPPPYIFGMKEHGYIMKLMTTYGTNELYKHYPNQIIYLDSKKNLVLLTFLSRSCAQSLLI